MAYRSNPHMTPTEALGHLDSLENQPNFRTRNQRHTLRLTNVNVMLPNNPTDNFGSIAFDLTPEQAQTVINLLEAMDVKVALVIDPVPVGG